MGVIDTHAHITCDKMYGQIEEVIQNAKQQGIEKVMIVCTNQIEFERAKLVQEKDPNYFDVMYGFHPCDINDVTEEDYVYLETCIKNKEIVALGEIGLDYYWDNVERAIQKEAFIRQIALANTYDIPIVVHMRDATQDTLEILEKHCKVDFLMHCFSASKEVAQRIMKMGGYISFAGPLTFKNAKNLQEVPSVCEKDKIFVETDCPYLTPHPFRGKANEVKYVQYTFDMLCELLKVDAEEMEKTMSNTYKKLFNNRK